MRDALLNPKREKVRLVVTRNAANRLDDWADRLEQLVSGDGEPLRPAQKAEIARECQRLHQVMADATHLQLLDRQARAY